MKKIVGFICSVFLLCFIGCEQAPKAEENKSCEHSWEDVGETATCTTPGYTLLKCSVCGETNDRVEIVALGHDMDDGTISKEALPPVKGVITYSCKRDGCTHSTEEEYLYFGTKEPSEEKSIGDIVFADGSMTPYSEELELNAVQKSKITDVIFYTGEAPDTIGDRVLGVSVVNSGSKSYAWCSADAALAAKGTNYNSYNGSKVWNWNCSADPEGTSDKKRTEMYPAFDYVLSNFSSEYYIPAYDELIKIYAQKEIVNKVIELKNGNIMEDIFIASSYTGSNHASCHYVRFSDGKSGGISKTNLNKVCAIREF